VLRRHRIGQPRRRDVRSFADEGVGALRREQAVEELRVAGELVQHPGSVAAREEPFGEDVPHHREDVLSVRVLDRLEHGDRLTDLLVRNRFGKEGDLSGEPAQSFLDLEVMRDVVLLHLVAIGPPTVGHRRVEGDGPRAGVEDHAHRRGHVSGPLDRRPNRE
jgi:hypothetical protein